ncbi:MerR family transcriptional regulator [Streptomyces sp. Wb2n-11]|uniref:MerR family transcriptional regulator n=1 Tax=Streptomyces sp. Wb2n-11 TaxID=1030533 RepID=UPI000A47DD31|nr:MerR family transcriptional regulator [Streptomyces sp. Wb2n-11]
MLSIGEFSEMCHLSPQTLRFYHSEGLLVPADVSERTGYRSYRFEQVEQAVLITALRSAGMSVRLVRRVLDEPDAAPALLQQHSAEVQRLRQVQDEAISDARALFGSWPEVRLCHVPTMTVVSKPVPAGPSAGRDPYDWGEVDAAVAAVAQEVTTTVESYGAVVSGTPWRTMADETEEQRRRSLSAEGPCWLVKVPVTTAGKAITALSGDMEVQTFEARDELAVFVPGKSSMAKYGTALSRLAMHPLDGSYIDVSRMRHLLHEDGFETTAAVRKLDEPGVDG